MEENKVTLSLTEYEKLVRPSRIIKEGLGGIKRPLYGVSWFYGNEHTLTIEEAEAKLKEVYNVHQVIITKPEPEKLAVNTSLEAENAELKKEVSVLKCLTELKEDNYRMESRIRRIAEADVDRLEFRIQELTGQSFWARLFGRGV